MKFLSLVLNFSTKSNYPIISVRVLDRKILDEHSQFQILVGTVMNILRDIFSLSVSTTLYMCNFSTFYYNQSTIFCSFPYIIHLSLPTLEKITTNTCYLPLFYLVNWLKSQPNYLHNVLIYGQHILKKKRRSPTSNSLYLFLGISEIQTTIFFL